MITKWTSHLKDPKEVERFKNSILGSKSVLERLDTMLADLERDETTADTTTDAYNTPNWAYLQADRNGCRRCLKAVRKMINLDQG